MAAGDCAASVAVSPPLGTVGGQQLSIWRDTLKIRNNFEGPALSARAGESTGEVAEWLKAAVC
jgi:hypothetical protein